MAVANKARRVPKHYEIKDEGGQVVNITATRGGITVGSTREIDAVQREFTVIHGRIKHLTDQAIQAPTDKEYLSKLQYVKHFERKFADLEPQVDRTLLLVISDWDLCLTEEDEARGLTVPLTPEGLNTLDRETKFDIFNKLMEAFSEEAEEKKESGANPTANGTPARVSTENAHPELSTTS